MGRYWRVPRQLLLIIATAVVYVFLIGPILVVAIASLEPNQAFRFIFPPEEFSLVWYKDIPEKYVSASIVSITVAALSASLSTIIGAAAALGIVRSRIGAKNLIQAFFRLPLQIPFVVTGIVFLQFYYQLSDWMGSALLGSLGGLVIAHVFITIPYCVSSIVVVLMRASPRLEETAQILGATHWSTFRRVTLPVMKPGLFAGFFYSFIVSFGDVPIAVFLVDQDHMTLPVEIFQTLQFDFDPAILSLSTLVVLFSFGLIIAVQRLAGLDLVLPSNRR